MTVVLHHEPQTLSIGHSVWKDGLFAWDHGLITWSPSLPVMPLVASGPLGKSGTRTNTHRPTAHPLPVSAGGVVYTHPHEGPPRPWLALGPPPPCTRTTTPISPPIPWAPRLPHSCLCLGHSPPPGLETTPHFKVQLGCCSLGKASPGHLSCKNPSALRAPPSPSPLGWPKNTASGL